jgi:hypothetical protein
VTFNESPRIETGDRNSERFPFGRAACACCNRVATLTFLLLLSGPDIIWRLSMATAYAGLLYLAVGADHRTHKRPSRGARRRLALGVAAVEASGTHTVESIIPVDQHGGQSRSSRCLKRELGGEATRARA